MARTETELYDKLQRFILPVSLLDRYNYPRKDPDNLGWRLVPAKNGIRPPIRSQLASEYTCRKCDQVYRVGPEGVPLASSGSCIHHPGRFWRDSGIHYGIKQWTCCKNRRESAPGCKIDSYHVHESEVELCHNIGFVETLPKPERDPNKHGIFGLDCEMCYTTHGLELTRVTVVNHKYEVVYESFVKPTNKLLDLNTEFSGIKPGDLDHVDKRLSDVQRDLLEIFSSKSLLIGHGLDRDMHCLKIFHENFIDTTQVFPHKLGLPYKKALKRLASDYLHRNIQEGTSHDSKEDARAALDLILYKLDRSPY